jgi:uncharacterized OsmC-like protein
MDSERVSFPSHSGERLAGLLDRPVTGPVRGHVLFAHCFTCNKNLKSVANISRALTDAGLAVLRFDFTGLGESGGEFAATGFSSNVADLLAAADYLATAHGGPELLVGHSLGGAAALMAAAQIKACRADHLLSSPADARYAGAVIASWASRYLDEPRADSPRPGVTARTGRRGFVTPLASGTHVLVADEPESAGGSDRGPSPYDLLSAALASCTSMTLQMHARHKGLALEQVRVTVTHAKVHAADCEQCETKTGRIDRFEREIALDGELDPAARQRLLEIADRCPVHRTLEGEVEIRSRLVNR